MLIKNEKEIEKIRIAAYINDFTLRILKDFIENNYENINAKIVDDLAFEIITTLGGYPAFKNYKPPFTNETYIYSITLSLNEEIVHGLPLESKVFKKGDIVSLDCGTIYKGFYADSAISFLLDDNDKLKSKLIKVCKEALDNCLEFAYHNSFVNLVSKAIEEYVLDNGFRVIKELSGHGVGKKLHEEPEIPNFYTHNYKQKLYNKMTIAIEPMITSGNGKIKLLSDKWTIITQDLAPAAHFEYTILITKSKPEILTNVPSNIFNEFYKKTKDIILKYFNNNKLKSYD
ncbi:MAG: type I methionyl aminopeptidase [bacterium]|jgi:methionyl aminopeptidase